MKKDNVAEPIIPHVQKRIDNEIESLKFTKNFQSASAEEWYIFLSGFEHKQGGAAGKVIIHYNLYGNKDMFINTTIIFDSEEIYAAHIHQLVYALVDEIVNRLIGYADTLVSVHAGENSYQAEFKS